MDTDVKRLVLTDPAPLRDMEGRCPQCRADESRRVTVSGFGQPHLACGVCGYQVLEER